MTKHGSRSRVLLVCTVVIAFAFSSCITTKRISYVQENKETGESTVYKNAASVYTIQPRDQLYLKVISLDQATTNMFNAESQIIGTNYNEIKLYLDSYGVSDSGTVDVPVVGHIKVSGLTVEEAKHRILKELDKYVNQVTVLLKLTSFQITLLGEVTRPGKYMIYHDQSTIFEALGQAGDLTDYANRKRIKLIRQTPEGPETLLMDLTDRTLLSSPQYYLQPHDVLYVAPLNAKSFGARSLTVGTLLSALTTLILILNYVNNTKS